MTSQVPNETMAIGLSQPVGGFLKRAFDVTFSIIALLTFAPLFLIIFLTSKLTTAGPVLFVHERVGLDGRSFGCLKFRTMVLDADQRLEALLAADPQAREEFERDRKLKNDPRVTPVIGKFLRSTSLDELPQFFNVLAGDMGVVGPRPVTAPEFELYGSAKEAYASVRPGITGLWQVSGRNSTTFNERVSIDKAYISSWSFVSDLKIVYRTLGVVLKREGAF